MFICMPEHELKKLRPLLKRGPGTPAHLHLKGQTQKQSVLAHTLKVVILTSYKKWSVGYFEHKLHIQALGTSETYFTSCYKGIIGLVFVLIGAINYYNLEKAAEDSSREVFLYLVELLLQADRKVKVTSSVSIQYSRLSVRPRRAGDFLYSWRGLVNWTWSLPSLGESSTSGKSK